jgi:hypothetical protein
VNFSPGYLNTDLDLSGDVELGELVSALEAMGLLVLHFGKDQPGEWHAILESGAEYSDPEATIVALLQTLDQLPTAEHRTWQTLSRREFNIGYACGQLPWGFNQGLSNLLLQRIAQVGGSLRITLYSPIAPEA